MKGFEKFSKGHETPSTVCFENWNLDYFSAFPGADLSVCGVWFGADKLKRLIELMWPVTARCATLKMVPRGPRGRLGVTETGFFASLKLWTLGIELTVLGYKLKE